MPKEEPPKKRKKVVVEEVKKEPDILTEGVSDSTPATEIKEKVGELQDITQTIGESVEKSEVVQDKIVEVADRVGEPRKSVSPAFFIIIPGIFLLGALLGGVFFYQRGINKGEEVVATPTPVESVSPDATASPEASLDLSKFSINVLNGSGISGEAGRAKDLLTGAGFSVSGTGNASAYNFTGTVVKAKESVDAAYLAKLVEALGKTYVVDKTQTLADSSPDNVQVIVGSSKN